MYCGVWRFLTRLCVKQIQEFLSGFLFQDITVSGKDIFILK